MSRHLEGLVDLADIDELIREIDRVCARRSWEELVELRYRCRRAVQSGRQLWGVAGHAEYRLALEAPPEFAALVAEADAGPFVPGPLPEVLARSHRWKDLADCLPSGPFRSLTAYECVAAGEDLSGIEDSALLQDEFELPLRLSEWEPQYAAVSYSSFDAQFPKPIAQAKTVEHTSGGQLSEDEPSVTRAIKSLAAGWSLPPAIATANGPIFVAAEAIEDSAHDFVEIELGDAVAAMAWAGAHGSAAVKRSGSAAGRSRAWWTLAALLGEPDCDAENFDELVADAHDCRWWSWSDAKDAKQGLRLGFSDESADLCFAFALRDE